eukprot:6602714-Karenia_brevis.AAC.1
MRIAVEKEYPDAEKHLPECDCLGIIPSSVEKLFWEHEREKRRAESEKNKLWKLKHATPGDAPQPIEKCLDHLRPQTVCMDRSTTAASDPATLREC